MWAVSPLSPQHRVTWVTYFTMSKGSGRLMCFFCPAPSHLSTFSHGQETTSVSPSASHHFLLLYSHSKRNSWKGIRTRKEDTTSWCPAIRVNSGASWAHTGPVERRVFPLDINLCSQIPSNIWGWRPVPLPPPSPSTPATWDIKKMCLYINNPIISEKKMYLKDVWLVNVEFTKERKDQCI